VVQNIYIIALIGLGFSVGVLVVTWAAITIFMRLTAGPRPQSFVSQIPQRDQAAHVSIPRRITAPMPGRVISISVHSGDAVVFGQELCVIASGERKTAVRVGIAGNVRSVLVNIDDPVSRDQVLFEVTEGQPDEL
jgi:biotin carboxyl carrier protein